MKSLTDLQDNPFVKVLTDSGTWVFAIGAAALAALIVWLILRFTITRHSNLVSVGAGVCPIMIIIGVVVIFETWQGRADSPIEFLTQPNVVFGLAIWFASGWLAARAVAKRFARRFTPDQSAIFE